MFGGIAIYLAVLPLILVAGVVFFGAGWLIHYTTERCHPAAHLALWGAVAFVAWFLHPLITWFFAATALGFAFDRYQQSKNIDL